MDSSNHVLLLEFDADHPEFARGFEAGRLWAVMSYSDEEVEATVHASNTEMVMRIAEAFDRPVEGQELDEYWAVVTFRRSAKNLGPSPRPEAL